MVANFRCNEIKNEALAEVKPLVDKFQSECD